MLENAPEEGKTKVLEEIAVTEEPFLPTNPTRCELVSLVYVSSNPKTKIVDIISGPYFGDSSSVVNRQAGANYLILAANLSGSSPRLCLNS